MTKLALIVKQAAQKHVSGYDPEEDSHKWTIQECCKDIAKEYGEPELAYPAYLLLDDNWNDALRWADNPEIEQI